MLKKRLIFCLLFNNGYFVLSRNFRLQKVGDINWINKNYNFSYISKFIDELIILNVSRDDSFHDKYIEDVKTISKYCFMPVILGGRINTVERCRSYFNAGADKVLINTALNDDMGLVNGLIDMYGAQSIVAGIDFKKIENDYFVKVDRGQRLLQENIESYLEKISKYNIGELYLSSIDKDGTGQGYDTEFFDRYERILKKIDKPIVINGGAGNKGHFHKYIEKEYIDGVCTANLLNFIGPALKNSRIFLIDESIPLANFNWE